MVNKHLRIKQIFFSQLPDSMFCMGFLAHRIKEQFSSMHIALNARQLRSP